MKLEISTVLGIVVGSIAVVVGMMLKGAPVSVLLNPAAIMIIFVGTFGALLNAFPMAIIKKFPVYFKLLLKKQEMMHAEDLVRMMVAFAQTARREGLLALENSLEEVKDPFLRSGLTMVIDGLDGTFVRDVLELDIALMEERHRTGALIFSQAGMYAPTLGVLGAVIGLIAALGNMADIDALGGAIAAAFVATMFGIFTGYVLWHPFSNKLKLMSKEEVELRRMMVEGILSLQAGDSPVAIEAKLTVFLPQNKRGSLKPPKEGE
jgi:chemotaxis protein MotA